MWCVYSCWLLLLMLFPSHLSAQDGCYYLIEDDVGEFSDTYLKLEYTLVSDHKSVLDKLRVGFSTIEINCINFELEIQVVNGTNVSCDWRYIH